MRRLAHALLVALVALTVTGCPTVDLGENPPDPPTCRPDFLYYQDVIYPEYIAPANTALSCVDAPGCHRVDDGRSALRLTINPPDHEGNYAIVSRFLNCGLPEASSMLTKPMSGVDPHGGGDMFDETFGPTTPRGIFEEWFNR